MHYMHYKVLVPNTSIYYGDLILPLSHSLLLGTIKNCLLWTLLNFGLITPQQNIEILNENVYYNC